VLAGENRGDSGRVLEVDRDRSVAFVEGLNLNKKHSKPTTANPQGGIVEKEGPIHISNLMLVDAKTGTPGRVGRKADKEGKLERYVKTKKTAAK
jgi:large subunit ribosomal protein L24